MPTYSGPAAKSKIFYALASCAITVPPSGMPDVRDRSRAGLQYLLSEDMQDGRRFGGLTIVNPFRPENAALVDRILPP
jgi:hypothetical protein